MTKKMRRAQLKWNRKKKIIENKVARSVGDDILFS